MRCSQCKHGEDRAVEYGQKKYRSKCSPIRETASTSESLEFRAQAGVVRVRNETGEVKKHEVVEGCQCHTK